MSNPVSFVLRRAVAPAGVAGAVAAVAFLVARGAAAGASAALGVLIGVAFFASGLVLLSPRLRRWDPAVSFVIAVTLYGLQVGVLLVIYELTGGLSWLDGVAVGVGILVVVLAFQLLAVLAWRHARIPIYDEAAVRADRRTPPDVGSTPSS
ncbi:MAG: hypothetical protein ABI746_02575 [Dermatophilaceae bacterium]